jgi:hypothetical protein
MKFFKRNKGQDIVEQPVLSPDGEKMPATSPMLERFISEGGDSKQYVLQF